MADEAIWVSTDPTPDGVYRATLTWGEDHALVLDQEAAATHAREVLAAVAAAEYDAAVVSQLTALTDQDSALHMVRELRKDRAAGSTSTGLELVPGVSAFTGQAYLKIVLDGKPIGQWDPDDARQHAMYVMEAVQAAELDSAYLRLLRGVIGLDEQTGRAAVAGLRKHRPNYEERP